MPDDVVVAAVDDVGAPTPMPVDAVADALPAPQPIERVEIAAVAAPLPEPVVDVLPEPVAVVEPIAAEPLAEALHRTDRRADRGAAARRDADTAGAVVGPRPVPGSDAAGLACAGAHGHRARRRAGRRRRHRRRRRDRRRAVPDLRGRGRRAAAATGVAHARLGRATDRSRPARRPACARCTRSRAARAWPARCAWARWRTAWRPRSST